MAEAARDFPCFGMFPKEIRELIWSMAANATRNLDIWITAGHGEFDAEMRTHLPSEIWAKLPGDDRSRIKSGKIAILRSTQPVPSILHTSSESREVGLRFYRMSFGTVGTANMGRRRYNIRPGTFPTPPRIYYNPHADRLCPMGTFSTPYILQLPQESDLRFAMNVYRNPEAMYRDHTDWGMGHIEEVLKQVGKRPVEIYLYCYERNTLSQYAGHLSKLTKAPGVFDFVDATKRSCTSREWEALNFAVRRIDLLVKRFEAENRRDRDRMEWGGKLNDFDSGADQPAIRATIRLVSLVLDGVRVSDVENPNLKVWPRKNYREIPVARETVRPVSKNWWNIWGWLKAKKLTGLCIATKS